MDRPERKPNRISNYDYSQNGAYFITICTQDRKKILSKISVGTPVPGCPQEPCTQLLPYGMVADKYIRQMDAFYDNLSVDNYVIMPDHIHLLITIHGFVGTGLPDCPHKQYRNTNGQPGTAVPTAINNRNSVIARFVGTFKRFCNKEYGGNIWQARYYDHVIRSQRDYDETWEYIEYNPRKWVLQNRGYE